MNLGILLTFEKKNKYKHFHMIAQKFNKNKKSYIKLRVKKTMRKTLFETKVYK